MLRCFVGSLVAVLALSLAGCRSDTSTGQRGLACHLGPDGGMICDGDAAVPDDAPDDADADDADADADADADDAAPADAIIGEPTPDAGPVDAIIGEPTPDAAIPIDGSIVIPPDAAIPIDGSIVIPPDAAIPIDGSIVVPPDAAIPIDGSIVVPPDAAAPPDASVLTDARVPTDAGPTDAAPTDAAPTDAAPADAAPDALTDAAPDALDAGRCGNGVCDYTLEDTDDGCPGVSDDSETPQNCPQDCNCCDYPIDVCGEFGNGTCNFKSLDQDCAGGRVWCAWGPDHVSDCCGDGYCDVDVRHSLYPDLPQCGGASGPETRDPSARTTCASDTPLAEQTGEDLTNCPSDCPCAGADGWDSGADGVCDYCNTAAGDDCAPGSKNWGGDTIPRTCDDTCLDEDGASDFDGRSLRWERAGQCSDCTPCSDGYDPDGQFNNAQWSLGNRSEGAGCDHAVDCQGNFAGWCAWGPDSYPDCWSDLHETARTELRDFGFCDPAVLHVRGEGRAEYLFMNQNNLMISYAASCPTTMGDTRFMVLAGENVWNSTPAYFLAPSGPYASGPTRDSLDCCTVDPITHANPTPHVGSGFEPPDNCDAGTCGVGSGAGSSSARRGGRDADDPAALGGCCNTGSDPRGGLGLGLVVAAALIRRRRARGASEEI